MIEEEERCEEMINVYPVRGQGGCLLLSVQTKCTLALLRRHTSKQNFDVVKWGIHAGFGCCSHLILKYFFFLQVEGKGNGIKTVIVNMVDVAKALNRPPTCK